MGLQHIPFNMHWVNSIIQKVAFLQKYQLVLHFFNIMNIECVPHELLIEIEKLLSHFCNSIKLLTIFYTKTSLSVVYSAYLFAHIIAVDWNFLIPWERGSIFAAAV